MAFALIFAGVLLAVSAARNTHNDLFGLIKSDVTGSGNFLFWGAVVLLIGAIGYIRPLRPLSQAFLALIVVVLILKRGDPSGIGGGVFQQFVNQLTFAGGQSTTLLNPQAGDFSGGANLANSTANIGFPQVIKN